MLAGDDAVVDTDHNADGQASLDSSAPRPARSALLIGDKALLKDIARIARAAVPDVRIAAPGDDLSAEPWDLVVVDYDGLDEEARAGILTRFARHQETGRLLLCMGGTQRRELATLFGKHALTHLLARSGEVDAEELLVTVQKILREDVFGIEKYFPWGAEVERISMRRASDRFEAIKAAASFAERKGAQPRFVELFHTAADELITNAIYNAPTDASGARCFAHRSRVEEVVLPDDKTVEAVFCADGRRLGISVTDPFGSLDAETVIAYLGKCFRKGTDQVDDKAGGAGLGLYYLFETLSQFIINLRAGERTELIGVLDIRGRYRDFSDRPKSFNVFQSPGLR